MTAVTAAASRSIGILPRVFEAQRSINSLHLIRELIRDSGGEDDGDDEEQEAAATAIAKMRARGYSGKKPCTICNKGNTAQLFEDCFVCGPGYEGNLSTVP